MQLFYEPDTFCTGIRQINRYARLPFRALGQPFNGSVVAGSNFAAVRDFVEP
jgi:hypothetical protein